MISHKLTAGYSVFQEIFMCDPSVKAAAPAPLGHSKTPCVVLMKGVGTSDAYGDGV